MKRYLFLTLMLCLLLGCGGEPAPTPDTVATQVAQAQAVAATLTAAAVPTSTSTPEPTDTSAPTNTPTITNTPSPTLSPTPRPTRRPTDTPRPTSTPTPLPGIGQSVHCDDMYEIIVLREFSFEEVVAEPPMGVYGRVYFQLTNLQSQTDSLGLFDEELQVAGRLNGKWVQFPATTLGTSLGDKLDGWYDWAEDLPPGIPVKMIAIFDVNPAVTDWVLVFAPEEGFDPVCEVQIRLEGEFEASSTATPRPVATSANTASPTSSPTKAPTPTASMQLLADSQADFTGGQGQNSWEYLFSEGRDSFNWKQMSFDGSCYRSPFTEEEMRICPDHGAPGAGGDIAWLYKAEASGALVFKVTAKKAETPGDDIEIKVYRHTEDIKEWDLDEGDTAGITKQFEVNANGGEMFFFTMQVQSIWREFQYDPNIFRVQVYLKE